MKQPVKKKKVLHIITQGNLGGAQVHLMHLALSLRDVYELHIAVGEKGMLESAMAAAGIAVHHLPSLRRPLSPFKDLMGLFQIVELIKNLRPDLVCLHSSKAGILGRVGAALCGVPAVFTVHGWAFTEGVPRWKKVFYLLIERFCARWARRIICVSDYDRNLALRYGVGEENQLVTIHNGIPEWQSGLTASTGDDNRPVRLIMVARFAEPKDQSSLLEAITLLNASRPFQVVFAGDGPKLQECQRLADKLHLGDRVRFLGARTDISELLASSDIFVLISKWEGLPITILEAMRAGLPVVASRVGGVEELVRDGSNGFLVPRGDKKTLIDRLERLIQDAPLRLSMGKQGREIYLDRFTLKSMVGRTAEIYEEILAASDICN